MTDRVAFTIPGTPEGKRRPRVDTRRGFAHVHPADADIKRERLIRQLAREAMAGRGPFPWAVRVTIEAVFEVTASWPKAKRAAARANRYHTSKPDADNVAKSVLDGLLPDPKDKIEANRAPFCLVDDTHVAELLIRKRYGDPARIEVVIEPLASSESLL